MTDDKIMKVKPNAGLPDFMRDEEVIGVDALKSVIVPPILKIVQKQSDDRLIDQFGKGTALLMPAEAIVARVGEPFKFTPVFFYPEWVTWSPIEMRGNMPAVLNKSLDPDSEIARKARVADTRIEKIEHEGKLVEVRHVEHLNFIVVLVDHPLGDEPFIMTFARAEHRTGSKFASQIRMRQASIFGCVFEAHVPTEPRKNDKGSWFGFNIENPQDGQAWVDNQERYEWLKAQHSDLKEKYTAGAIKVDYDTEPDEEKAPTEL